MRYTETHSISLDVILQVNNTLTLLSKDISRTVVKDTVTAVLGESHADGTAHF